MRSDIVYNASPYHVHVAILKLLCTCNHFKTPTDSSPLLPANIYMPMCILVNSAINQHRLASHSSQFRTSPDHQSHSTSPNTASFLPHLTMTTARVPGKGALLLDFNVQLLTLVHRGSPTCPKGSNDQPTDVTTPPTANSL